MAGLLSALLLSVGLGSVGASQRALPTIPASLPPSSFVESVAAPSSSSAAFAAGPHLAVPYFGARYYRASHGRFTTVDPVYTWRDNLVDPQRWNRYAYGRNNPFRFVDPDGREIMLPAGSGPAMAANMEANNAALGKVLINTLRAINSPGHMSAEKARAYYEQPDSLDQALRMDVADLLVTGGLALTFAPVAKAAPAQVQVNRAVGNAFRDEMAGLLQNAGRETQTEVFKKTPFGPRTIDIEVSQGGRVLGGVETKTGGSRYTPSQRAKDAWLKNAEGYPITVVRDK